MGNVAGLGFALPAFPAIWGGPPALPGTGAQPAAVDGLSKRARKRAAKDEMKAAKKRARKEAARAESKVKEAERVAVYEKSLEGLTPDEREKFVEAKRARSRELREADRVERERVRGVMMSDEGLRVCIDLGWTESMLQKELKSLVKQIAYSYCCVRKAVEEGHKPLRLSVSGLEDEFEGILSKHGVGWEEWPVSISRDSLEQLHRPEDIVYLTHDAEDVLDELDQSKVYVIGGIVDRNRLKGATLQKARNLGVATARLNLDTSVHIETGTPVLTVNHCVDILLQAANGMTWQDAYMKVLPPRKNLQVSSGANAEEEE